MLNRVSSTWCRPAIRDFSLYSLWIKTSKIYGYWTKQSTSIIKNPQNQYITRPFHICFYKTYKIWHLQSLFSNPRYVVYYVAFELTGYVTWSDYRIYLFLYQLSRWMHIHVSNDRHATADTWPLGRLAKWEERPLGTPNAEK